MKIKLWSDLHLEFPFSSVPIERDGADVLILAGDICVPSEMDRFVPWFEKVSKTFPDVIYIAGNHEYYHSDFGDTYDKIQKALAHLPNIHVLDGGHIEIQGRHFWAGTMWTDFNGGDEETIWHAGRHMNDYRLITNAKEGDLLSPHDTLKEHLAQRTGLNVHLEGVNGQGGHPDDIVVITHHAPSKKSIHPRYKTDFNTNGAYSSDLTPIMAANPNIKLWVHGHTHDSFDYIEHQTRIVANPAGYPLDRNGKRENANFDPSLVLEI